MKSFLCAHGNVVMVYVFIACLFQDACSRPLRIAVFTPTSKENTYWPQVYKLLNAVADDLHIVLVPHEFDVSDRFSKAIDGTKILRQEAKLDGAIFSVAFGQAAPLLEEAQQQKIPAFIQGPLFPQELALLGDKPREKYRYWIGSFSQNENEKGYLAAKGLLEAAHDVRKETKGDKVRVVGIGGDRTWIGSEQRNAGLARAVAEDPAAILLQVVPTYWSAAEGKRVTQELLRRYPEVDAVWAASDQLALGAVAALKESGRMPGKNTPVSGIDLSETGLSAVKKGSIVTTAASLMISYGEILICLHDYLHGIDFADDVGTEIVFRSYSATKKNSEKHLLLLKKYDALDFKNYSKVYNKELKRYDFSFDRIANDLR